MGSITLEKVSKSFGTTSVIPHIDLEINDGEFVVFVGPSGCGKSTLLRMIAGLEDLSGGRIIIDGKDMSSEAPAKRGLSMVFQSYALYPHMTVYGNIAFPLKMDGQEKSVIDKKVKDAAHILNLTNYLERRPGQLSGGQRQRVALARALVNKPKVLLLDEPLGALDLKLREQMQEELKTLQKSLGITFVFVTHDQGEALSMADRIAVFNEGRIQQLGTPEDVYKRPKTRFVADFVGSSNILQPEFVTQLGAGRQLASLRPEAIELTGKKDGQLSLSGIVLSRSFLGASNRITVDVSGTKLHVTSPAASPVPEEGSKVTLSFAPADLHLMEAV